jgi:alkylation response protein AidB-like acyl-CoA dehydrogenase
VDLNYPPELEAFADEVRAYVQAELPEEVKIKVLDGRTIEREERIDWQRKMCAKGWAAPEWPMEYGGTGWDELKRHVFNEVMSDEGAPAPVPFGQAMLAPVLFGVGTQEQKDHYLPRILTLEYFFCQGYSEPGSGSDLASLKTRAELNGDEWVINGQKMWTSWAHQANMIFLLAKTDPDAAKPQEGISMLIFPLDTPGIEIRPIITLAGEHHVNEVFFDDVRIPKNCIIGEPNLGWTYAKTLLGHERTNIARIGQSKRELRRLKALANHIVVDGAPLMAQANFKSKVAALEVELMGAEISNLRMLADTQRNAPGFEANMLKIKGSEIQQTLTELVLDALGPESLRFDRSVTGENNPENIFDTDYAGHQTANYLMTRVVTIYGGSNEIQRNILAKGLLGL